MGLPQALVRQRMLFWVAHGVVTEQRGAAGGGSSSSGSSGSPGGDVVYRRAEALPQELSGALGRQAGKRTTPAAPTV